MLLNQLLPRDANPLKTIQERCSSFILESNGLPLYKNLSVDYDTVHKVKARRRNVSGNFVESFNTAFGSNLAQRAIFANGQCSFAPAADTSIEPFYIFPINGYKYLYSPEVDNSSEDYKTVLETMFSQFGSEKARTIVTDLLKFAYKQEQLAEGIERGAEIVFYNIPFYYAVKVSSYPDYTDVLTSLTV